MKEIWKQIGEHHIRFRCLDVDSALYLDKMFAGRPSPEAPDTRGHYQITIRQGGASNDFGLDTVVSRDAQGGWRFERPDYRLAFSADYREADIRFYNYIGLRTVMMNWYGSVIASLQWGLVVHSSCVIHNGQAYLFAGKSGAGKTTVASLSHPRKLLSDEATLVHLSPDGPATVYDSPMRSSLFTPSPVPSAPLRAIYLLEQSKVILKEKLSGGEALLSLFDKIWYWPHRTDVSTQVVRLCKTLAETVPVYRLEFQKNDLFWEAI